MEGEDGLIALAGMIDTHVALLWGSDVGADEAEYRRGWPEAVNPIAAYRLRFPRVVPVDKTIALAHAVDRARIVASEDPASFADDAGACAQTERMHRYVIYAHDGFGRFARNPDEAVAAMSNDELPITLTEGIYLVLHHARAHAIRHGIVCAGSRDKQGRFPAISAVSRGYLLHALEPGAALFRHALASRGTIIPASI